METIIFLVICDERVIVHFRVEEISCYFFCSHFCKIFKAKKNNGIEMSFLKYESRNEMLIYCFACRDFIRSFFII